MLQPASDLFSIAKSNFAESIAKKIDEKSKSGEVFLVFLRSIEPKILDSVFIDEVVSRLEDLGYRVEKSKDRIQISWA